MTKKNTEIEFDVGYVFSKLSEMEDLTAKQRHLVNRYLISNECNDRLKEMEEKQKALREELVPMLEPLICKLVAAEIISVTIVDDDDNFKEIANILTFEGVIDNGNLYLACKKSDIEAEHNIMIEGACNCAENDEDETNSEDIVEN